MVILLVAIVVVVVAIVVVFRLLLAELARTGSGSGTTQANRAVGKAGVSATPFAAVGAAGRVAVGDPEQAADIEQLEAELRARAAELEERELEAERELAAARQQLAAAEGQLVDETVPVRTRDIGRLLRASGWRRVRSGTVLVVLVALLGVATAALVGLLGLLIALALERAVS